MATNLPLDIIGSFDKSYSSEFDPQELINCFVTTDPMGKKGKAIFPTPGLSLDNGTSIQTGKAGRRLYPYKDHMYWVVGSQIYRVDTSLNLVFIGDINTETGYVGISDNGREVIFVDGTAGWLWNDSTGSFSQISSVGFPLEPTDVSLLGARFVVSKVDSGVLHFSGINNGTTWDALDTFSIGSDSVIGLKALNDRLYIMGTKITQTWYNAGNPILPFARVETFPYGCAAVGSIYEAFGFLAWLSKDEDGVGSIVMTSGTTPKPVSTKSLLTEFQRYSNVSDANSFIYRNDQGHVMYQINFTEDNKSWALDITEGNFIRLEYNSKDRHLANDHAFLINKHYVIDHRTSSLYEMSSKYLADVDVNIRRTRVPPIFSDPNYRYMIINSITFDLKQGVGSSSCGKNASPKLRLRVSIDGGLSYGNELTADIGDVGRREYETKFFRLGRAKSFVFKITMDNEVPFVLLGASINVTAQGNQ